MSYVLYVFISSAFSLLSAPRLLLAEIFLSFRHFKGAGSESWCNMWSLHVCLKDHNFINRPLMLVREKVTSCNRLQETCLIHFPIYLGLCVNSACGKPNSVGRASIYTKL